ncbi:AraC family transcriptional regulator [Variovorax sp. dw_308]|uniref:AraC family transcriptional regulator n=1 Tax=Variovorax sp. dw_308 TaxID=2721546 RepID=UPI001C46CCB5|nr:AraC family transcriptional regulator [Variovorax sp. dw_308]
MQPPVHADPVAPATRGLSLRRYGASRGSHAHDHFQVLVGLSGQLDLEVEGRGRHIAPGEGWVIAPGDQHDFESSQGAQCLVLDTSDLPWSRAVGRTPMAQRTLSLARYLALCLGQPDSPRLALHHGPALLLEAWGPLPASASRRRAIDWAALSLWAQARWQRTLTVADMAAVVCLSPSQFAQRCRDEWGMGAMQWLRQQRLVHARQLRGHGMSVAEVARRTGYRSPSALTAAMRREEAPAPLSRLSSPTSEP